MAAFIADLNDLFGGFRQRAEIVQAALRSPDVSFVLVTSPSPVSIDEVLFFNDRLVQASMPRGAFVVNRFRGAIEGERISPPEGDVATAATRLDLVLDAGAPGRMLRAHADAERLAALDAVHVEALCKRVAGQVPIVRVAEMAADVHDLRGLGAIATTLMAGGV
jgi:anion-transporting  ArsA/GET3 family ATPase